MSKKILIALLVLGMLLTSCAAARSLAPTTSSDSARGAPGVTSGLAPAQPQSAPEQQLASANNPFAKGLPSSSNTNQTEPSANRIVIRDANLAIVVPDPLKALDAISKMATDLNGYIVTSNAYQVSLDNGGEAPEANITVRVPAEKLNDAIATIKQQVRDPQKDVLSENVNGQDVTKEYTDLQSRLKNLQDAEAQLREIMASATKPDDVLNIFNQLTQVREQIEVLQGQINYYNESANFSAVTVKIKAEAAVQPLTIGRWQPEGVARDALQALVDTGKFLANVAIWLVLFALPVGVVLYAIARLLWIPLRWLFRRRKPSKPAAPSAPPAAPTQPA